MYYRVLHFVNYRRVFMSLPLSSYRNQRLVEVSSLFISIKMTKLVCPPWTWKAMHMKLASQFPIFGKISPSLGLRSRFHNSSQRRSIFSRDRWYGQDNAEAVVGAAGWPICESPEPKFRGRSETKVEALYRRFSSVALRHAGKSRAYVT